MKQDIMTFIIAKLVETGLDEVDAKLMVVDLLTYLKYEEIITINDSTKTN